MVHDNNDIVDKEYKDLCAEMYAEGHSFFTYLSDSADSLASCCFSGDTKVLWKNSYDGVKLTTLKELYDLKWEPYKKNLTIFHNGSWVKGKAIKLPPRPLYKVETYNNKVFYMTDNHINVTLRGEVTTENLTTDDYLMFNTMCLQAPPENDEHLTYEMGFVVGAFLGDGSFGQDDSNGVIHTTHFSLNADKYRTCRPIMEKCLQQMGLEAEVKLGSIYNSVYPVSINSKEVVAMIQRWTLWTRGTLSFNKKLNLECLVQSSEFRKGILEGWYTTDGGNSNRCYTVSSELAENMEVLITSLGMQSIINISDRTSEPVIIRGEKFARNYPLYCVRWYESNNTRKNKDVNKSWIKFNNSIYFRIKSIELTDRKEDAYCIECKEEPYFTLPCGLITHNCRLRNELAENTFSPTSGLTGVDLALICLTI